MYVPLAPEGTPGKLFVRLKGSKGLPFCFIKRENISLTDGLKGASPIKILYLLLKTHANGCPNSFIIMV